jgi:hypothetical protein
MTINDVCPGMSKLPPVDQALELLSRTCGDLRLALLSKQMLRKDRDQVERDIDGCGRGGQIQSPAERWHDCPGRSFGGCVICSSCPHNMFVEICPCFGYCLNLQHFVITSSDCEKEGG